MSRSAFRRRALGLACLVLATLGARSAAAGGPAMPASPGTARDFLIQNVCVGRSQTVLEGVSPIDGDPACTSQRDLMPGETLPYHKHDHPAAPDRAALARGYQRHDSFPVETSQFGIVVEHSFDFGAGRGRQFGVFDASDGGDITLVSPQALSFAATEDGGAGFQLFVGEACRDRVNPAALKGSWIIALLDPLRPFQGETVARLNAAFTRWYIAPVGYRAAEGQGAPITLTSLISEHYGGAQPQSADHVERFYFTRELGSTRWERWQNVSHSRDFSPDEVARAASDLAASGRCSQAPPPAGGAPLALVDCREWTLIVPPDKSDGDRPGFFIDALRARRLGGGLFAAPRNSR